MLCKFCGSALIPVRNITKYLLCTKCDTYSRTSGDEQSIMVNEKLGGEMKPDQVTYNQIKILEKSLDTEKLNLLDFGSGGGKFLLLARKCFNHVAGIEITPASVAVAQSNGLEIYSEIQPKGFDVITFWHSLEHLPYETLIKVLEDINLSSINFVVLSVPNAQSLTLKYFGDFDAFEDEPNHTFIFSKKLLIELFQERNFFLSDSPVIRTYNSFGIVQSSINFVTQTKNQLYFILKRGYPIKNIKIIRHIFLAPVYFTIIILLKFICSLTTDRDSVTNLVFERID